MARPGIASLAREPLPGAGALPRLLPLPALLLALLLLAPGPLAAGAALPSPVHPPSPPHALLPGGPRAGLGASAAPSTSTPATTLHGIDVSSYQGTVNWGSVASNGVVFAFAKASQGNYYSDGTWPRNAQNGKAAGVYIGAYDFADPVNVPATTEANYFDSVAGPYFTAGYMYPALDLEQGCGTLSVSSLSAWVNAWMTTVKNYIAVHDGYNIAPIIYLSSNYANNCVDSSVTQWHPWIADWFASSPNTGHWGYWNYWQYSDSGSEPGISGAVDLDYFNGGVSQLQSGFVFGTAPPSATYAVQDLTTGGPLYCGGSFSAGDTIQFTASVSGGTPPYSYAWNFGDGSGGSGNPATHVYSTPGTVNPTLVVTDAAGRTASTGSGCDFTVTGTPVTFYTVPANVGAVVVGGVPFTNGQSSTYPLGKTYTLAVSAPPGYIFSGWSWTGGVLVAAARSATTTLTISGNTPATVTVSLITRTQLLFLSSPPSMASASVGGATYTDGQNMTLTVGTIYPLLAVPNPGWVFVAWQVSGTGISVESLNEASTNLTVVSTSSSTLTEVVLYNVPKAPLDVAITAATTTTLAVRWTPPPGALVAYHLGYAPGSSAPSGAAGGFQVASFGAGGTSYTLTGLALGTEYWVALAGVNSTGQGEWSPWTVGTTLSLPDPPLYLAVAATGPGYGLLTWQPPATGSSVSSYTLNCTAGPGTVPRLFVGIPPSTTLYNVTGLTDGATYRCFMVSHAGPYASLPSNTVDLPVPVPGGPTSSSAGGWAASWPWPLSLLSSLSPLLATDVALLVVLLAVVTLFLAARKKGRSGKGKGGPRPPGGRRRKRAGAAQATEAEAAGPAPEGSLPQAAGGDVSAQGGFVPPEGGGDPALDPFAPVPPGPDEGGHMALGGDLGPSPPAEVGGPSDLHEVPHPGAPPDTLGPFAPVPEEAPAPPPVVSEFPRQSFREEPKGTSPHAPVLPRPRGPSPPS